MIILLKKNFLSFYDNLKVNKNSYQYLIKWSLNERGYNGGKGKPSTAIY